VRATPSFSGALTTLSPTETPSRAERVGRCGTRSLGEGGAIGGVTIARMRALFPFVSMLVVMFAVKIWAQAFGLRALSTVLQCESPILPVAAPEVQKAPIASHVKRIVMGDSALGAL
jgi:hypothetical protein